jgi:sulfane dehydrogenase subunit SoxC
MSQPSAATLDVNDWRMEKDVRLTPYGDTNLGTPPALLDQQITPTDVFFVRSNYAIPAIDADAWRLRVTGLVDTELELTLTDLQALPQRTITAVLECAGNSRTRLDPPAEGTPWRDDAVGNAVWTGVPLASVLDLAGVAPTAVDVVTQGGDDASMRRGLPIEVARHPDTLLVLSMNGEPLRQAHGFPVRLLVPGWGGIASTKWLVGIEVLGERFDGHWNSEKYVLQTADGVETGRVQQMPVKSNILTPLDGAVIAPGVVEVKGYAWSGDAPVESVELSVDGGPWMPAELGPSAGPRAWTPWRCRWTATTGAATLRARARDAAGHEQPQVAPWNAQGYQNNAWAQVNVVVTKTP